MEPLLHWNISPCATCPHADLRILSRGLKPDPIQPLLWTACNPQNSYKKEAPAAGHLETQTKTETQDGGRTGGNSENKPQDVWLCLCVVACLGQRCLGFPQGRVRAREGTSRKGQLQEPSWGVRHPHRTPLPRGSWPYPTL